MYLVMVALSLAAGGDDEWQPIFNGTNYAGLTFWIPGGPEETFDVEDGCMVIKPVKAGFTYTRRKYRNYELSYDWRYEKSTSQGNGGVLLHITIPLLKEWPRSIEVDAKTGEE